MAVVERSAIPERILGDFGGKAEPTRFGVCTLAMALSRSSSGSVYSSPTGSSQASWLAHFRTTCGQDWPRPAARLDRLAKHYGVEYDPDRPEIVLFALHSWYVFLIKALVAHVVSAARGVPSPMGGDRPGWAGHARELVADIEGGELFAAFRVTDPWQGEPFDWFGKAWSPELERAVSQVAERLAGYDPAAIMAFAAAGGDLLKPLYESLFSRAVRHALGEYYTPAWLAEHVLDQVGYHGQADARLLDPTCGSGTFLLAAIRRWRRSALASLHRAEAILPTAAIQGFDLHPLAVASARANYLLAIADLLRPESQVDVPVFARDAILNEHPNGTQFEFIVGNPPWIAWDNLPGDYREATKPHWQRYGLFSLSGNEARHGGGKKDLSMLVLYTAADRHLATAGRLGMVITQTLFQSKGAGDGFRRFRLGADGPPLKVLRVDDMVQLRPFDDAANWSSVIVLQKGETTEYPVQYVKWTAPRDGKDGGATGRGTQCEMRAQPIDPKEPTTPWFVQPRDAALDLSQRIGPADYQAHLGANSGGANAVYWLEVLGKGAGGVRVRNLVGKAKRSVEPVEALIEPDLLYPLVRWCDVDRWTARPSAWLLLAQNAEARAGWSEDRLRCDYPQTLAYLQRFEHLLRSRAAYRRYQDRQPFYSMYNVGIYTLSPAKVIWRRMDHKIRAAVVETIDDPLIGRRPVVPQETCVMIACHSGDEAHYLCALLNSSLTHVLVASHSVAGGKGFGTPSILDYLPLWTFNAESPQHAELARLSRTMHATPADRRGEALELREIDRLAENVLHV